MADVGRFDAFLCHASADKAAVDALRAHLEGHGLTMWFDTNEMAAGDSIIGAIERGLTGSDHILVCLSSAFATTWTELERTAALHAELKGSTRVIPVVVGDLDGWQIPLLLAAKRRVDVRTGPGLDELVGILRRSARSGSAPSPRGPATEHRLLLRAAADGALEGTWSHDGTTSDPFPLKSPLEDEDVEAHRWYLEEFLRFPGTGDRVRAASIERRLRAWGEALFEALRLPGEDHPLNTLLAKPEPRILTLVSADAAALALPWELLHDSRGRLALRGLVLRRQLPERRSPSTPKVGLPLRILLIVARPDDVGFIDPRSSAAPMLDALDALGGAVTVDFCEPPTLSGLEQRLDGARRAGRPYHVVHFDGHGVYLQHLGVGALCFEDADANNDLVPGPRLGELLAHHDVPVALLEACQTAQLSTTVFGSLAPALLRSGVGSVIAFSHSVTVSAARVLVEAFYRALTHGDSVGEALAAGRRALHANPKRHAATGELVDLQDFHLAQLYQVGPDPVLVPGGAPVHKAPSRAGRAVDPAFPTAPMYGFHGRSRTLSAVERLLRSDGAVALVGGGGMGKTALTREAAEWWRRTGKRKDGAAFFSFESRASADAALLHFGAYAEGDSFRALGEEERWKRGVAAFRDREVLWVWDNFESVLPQFQEGEATRFPDEERSRLVALYQELSAPGASGWLLVTCRPGEVGLPGIAVREVEGLSEIEAMDLAGVAMRRAGVPLGTPGYDREAIDRLLSALGGHPLSIELVVPHLAETAPDRVVEEFRALVGGFRNVGAKEERNRGLLASLAFSTRRLGVEARAALPWLVWFSGGVFEQLLLWISEMDPEAWTRARAELEATALVRVEGDVGLSGRPFLRFHPTLPFAAEPGQVADPEAGRRFVDVYRSFADYERKELNGKEPAAAVTVLAREEANLRRAAERAFGAGRTEEGWGIADAVRMLLKMRGRPREQARWIGWARARMPTEGGDPASLDSEREHAWTLLLEGKAAEAVAVLQAQRARLADGEPQQAAWCAAMLGRVLLHAGRPDLALDPLAAAANTFDSLGDDRNFSVVLGDQAIALQELGRHAMALAAAERSVGLNRAAGRAANEAASLGQVASILMSMGKLADADVHYAAALETARRAGARDLEGGVLQHRAGLADDRGDYVLAVQLYQDALAVFQEAGDTSAEMQTCNLLGVSESHRGELDSARAWYQRARELALRRRDTQMLGITLQNLGILLQEQAEATSRERPAERERLLSESVPLIEESLSLQRSRSDRVGEASSLFQLGVVRRLLGDLSIAENHALAGLAISEALDLPDVGKDYANLELIALARNDPATAASWRAKKEAKLADRQRLARGDGPPRLRPEVLKAFIGLAQAVHHHRTHRSPLPADAREALASMEKAPQPYPALAAFFTDLARGGPVPSVPAELPEDLDDLLKQLVAAC